jgi:spermidine synthase
MPVFFCFGRKPASSADEISGMMVMMNNEKILFAKRTPYGALKVAESSGQRILYIDGHMQSAIYTDQEKENELIFPYMQRFSYAFAVNPAIHRTLLIGGGAFAYPRYYLSHYPGAEIDVVEISDDILSADEKYFYLSTIKDERMKIIQKDGFQYLMNSSQMYDLIINDAFAGSQQAGRDHSSAEAVHRHLSRNGIYLINAATAVKGLFSQPYHHTYEILKKEFQYTAVLQCEEDRSLYEKQNILLAASDRPLM